MKTFQMFKGRDLPVLHCTEKRPHCGETIHYPSLFFLNPPPPNYFQIALNDSDSLASQIIVYLLLIKCQIRLSNVSVWHKVSSSRWIMADKVHGLMTSMCKRRAHMGAKKKGRDEWEKVMKRRFINRNKRGERERVGRLPVGIVPQLQCSMS